MTLLIAVRPDDWPDDPERFVREEIAESDLEDLNEFCERTLKPLLAALRKGKHAPHS